MRRLKVPSSWTSSAWLGRRALWRIAGKTGDPERALSSLLERDRMFTSRLREETCELGLPAIEVEVAMSEDALVGLVETRLVLGVHGAR